MKKLSRYKVGVISKNLEKVFDQCTKEEYANGKEWYYKTNRLITSMADTHGVDVLTATQVMSALSPRNRWEQNIKDANKVMEAWRYAIHPDDIKVCTFNVNKLKAFEILRGNKRITISSPKTHSFVRNIALLDPRMVTVDVWHLRACLFSKVKINKANIGKVAYQQIVDITKKLAKKHNLTGFEFQAILWLTAQRIL